MKVARLGMLVLLVSMPAVPVEARPACSERKAAKTIKRFVTAYNDGDFATLDRLFAPADDFREYRVMPLERPAPLSEDRDTLLDYFGSRHSQNDKMQLVDLDVGREVNGTGYWAQPTFTRTSDEPLPWSSGRFEPGKSGTDNECRITLLRLQWTP